MEAADVSESIARQLMDLLDGTSGIKAGDHITWEVQESSRSDNEFIVVATERLGDKRRCYRVTVALDDADAENPTDEDEG